MPRRRGCPRALGYGAIGSAVPVTCGTGGPDGACNTASSWGVAATIPLAAWKSACEAGASGSSRTSGRPSSAQTTPARVVGGEVLQHAGRYRRGAPGPQNGRVALAVCLLAYSAGTLSPFWVGVLGGLGMAVGEVTAYVAGMAAAVIAK